MSSLEAAALWVGLNIFLLAHISYRVGQVRIRNKINLGDGDGNEEMVKAIRAQGNYIEYAPAALLGLVLLALLDVSAMIIHGFGAVFFLARVTHFLGLGMNVWAKGRLVGIILTMLSLLATGVYLIYLAIV